MNRTLAATTRTRAPACLLGRTCGLPACARGLLSLVRAQGCFLPGALGVTWPEPPDTQVHGLFPPWRPWDYVA